MNDFDTVLSVHGDCHVAPTIVIAVNMLLTGLAQYGCFILIPRSFFLETMYLQIFAVFLLVSFLDGFVSSSPRTRAARASTELHVEASDRRLFLNSSVQAAAILSTLQQFPANAVMTNDQNIFKTGQSMSVDEAKARFREGRKSLKYLLDNYDKVVEGGGDNVRRYLGTVGTTSGLWGIGKVMRSLQDEADDIVDYTETMQEVEASIRGADSAAYMAIFVKTSSSGTPPAKYFGDAKIEANRALTAMDDLAVQLNLN